MLIRIVQVTEIHVSDDPDPSTPSAIDVDAEEIPPSAPRLRVARASRPNHELPLECRLDSLARWVAR